MTHRGSELRVITIEEWNHRNATAVPITALTPNESAAVAWHLRYWLGESQLRPGYEMTADIDVEYDF